jgi:Domain of unknown function (DUF4249)
MKNILKIIAIATILLTTACQDVVEIPLNTDNPKLVIEASINWQKGTAGNIQRVKLTTTTNYYTNTIPTVSGANITIKNSTNTIFNFIEIPNTGEYVCNNFIPLLNETYTLSVNVNGQNYTATEQLIPVAPITSVVQNNQGGITGNRIDVKAFFTDVPNIDNYYFYKYNYLNTIKPEFNVDDDSFFQGNQFFSISRNRELKVGDKIEITHYGISQNTYNYLNILLSIAGSQGGGPFQTPPATVRGNIKNNTDFQNYPLGFFRLSETDFRTYIIQ